MPANEINPDPLSTGQGSCPACNDRLVGKERTGGTPNVSVREYTPPTPEELEFTQRVYARMDRQPFANAEGTNAADRQVAAAAEAWGAIHPGEITYLPEASAMPIDAESPTTRSMLTPTPAQSALDARWHKHQHSVRNPAALPPIGISDFVNSSMGAAHAISSQLTAPWLSHGPELFNWPSPQSPPEEGYDYAFNPQFSRSYQFPPPPPILVPTKDGKAQLKPCCQVRAGPKFNVSEGGPARYTPALRHPDGSFEPGKIEVVPTKIFRPGGVIAYGVSFSFRAEFFDQLPLFRASCCEVRLMLHIVNPHRRDGAYPHPGFAADDPRDRWVEDRMADGRRYGHRRDPNVAGADEYLADRPTGSTYLGQDKPGTDRATAALMAAADERWMYLATVVDTCCGGLRAVSDILEIVWKHVRL